MQRTGTNQEAGDDSITNELTITRNGAHSLCAFCAALRQFPVHCWDSDGTMKRAHKVATRSAPRTWIINNQRSASDLKQGIPRKLSGEAPTSGSDSGLWNCGYNQSMASANHIMNESSHGLAESNKTLHPNAQHFLPLRLMRGFERSQFLRASP